jgi:hypothetical protein
MRKNLVKTLDSLLSFGIFGKQEYEFFDLNEGTILKGY